MKRRTKEKRLPVAAFILGMVGGVGCADDSLDPPFCGPVPPFSLSPNVAEIGAGEEITLRRVRTEDAECGFLPDAQELVWTLDGEGVATIVASDDSAAVIHGDAAGSVIVTATVAEHPETSDFSTVVVR